MYEFRSELSEIRPASAPSKRYNIGLAERSSLFQEWHHNVTDFQRHRVSFLKFRYLMEVT